MIRKTNVLKENRKLRPQDNFENALERKWLMIITVTRNILCTNRMRKADQVYLEGEAIDLSD